MTTRITVGLLIFSLLGLASCGNITGRWSLAKVDPEAARRNTEYHVLTLQNDGTFYAEANEPPGIRTCSGTYTYRSGVLNLKAHDGEQHTFDVALQEGTQVLQLARHQDGRRVVMKYERNSQ